MFKNLYNRILTNHPLLWNTRFVWVIATAIVFHLFFLFAGFVDISASVLQEHYSLTDVLSGGLLTFSILCSLVILIVWLVFYLRNNAYKNFYIIGKYHSAKEFFIIYIIILFSITFFESYKLGTCLKARSITSKEQLVKEANIVNLASAFIPLAKSDYFKLNNCDDPAHGIPYQDNINYFDSTYYGYNDSNSIVIRKVISDGDAFSYKNYCTEEVRLRGYKGFVPAKEWKETITRWIDNHNTDSITQILEQCVAICRKYNIQQRIDPKELTRMVFVDSMHNVSRFLSRSNYNEYESVNQPGYFKSYELSRALYFIDECYFNSRNDNDWMEFFTIEMYVALSIAIFLFCYRLYSRRIFLISVIGVIVWCIVFALFAVSSRSVDTASYLYIFLFALFLLFIIISLNTASSKTATGVTLNWHAFMLPFFLLIIIALIEDNYRPYEYINGVTRYLTPEELKRKYPFTFWVTYNSVPLIRLNILLVLLYTAFFFTRLSKKWHITPEE
jgi:hypothetical protein